MAAPAEFLQYIDANADAFIQRLADAVAIPSVSGDANRRGDVVRMAHWLNDQLKALGVDTKLVDLRREVLDGQEPELPPAILGTLGVDPAKKTVLIYGHFDVQPADKSEGWNTDPFTLVVDKENGQLIGRGSSDDKGPILGWLNVLQYHYEKRVSLPVNLKFCFEGMEESDSEGLDKLVWDESKPGGYFNGVDCACISDNYWLNTRTPVVTYGIRGLTYFKVTVSGPGRDLHSGVWRYNVPAQVPTVICFGGTVYEPMTALIQLMGKLVDSQGKILIPGVAEMVQPAGDDEKAMYERLDYSVTDLEEAAGSNIALTSNKVDLLMGRMRNPSLSLHGIEGAFSEPGAKTVIPANVSGKFSIRLVPPQTPEAVDPLVEAYLQSEFAKLNTKTTLVIDNIGGGKPWVADYTHWHYEAAKRATTAVYKKDPDLTREGGSIPVTLTFAESLGVNVVLLPMGRGDDGAHSTNEKLDRSNFIEGSKLLGSYLYELAALTKNQ